MCIIVNVCVCTLYKYMLLLNVCMHICTCTSAHKHPHVLLESKCSMRPENGTEFPGAGVTGDCVLPNTDAEDQTWVSCKGSKRITSLPCL